jgi:nucleoside diphosphate kinase
MSEYFEGQDNTRETFPKRDLAFAFLKPDFLDDLPAIERILKENGLDIIYKTKLRLSPEQVDAIYREARDKPFYEAMKRYLTEKDVLILLIYGQNVDAQTVLNNLKKAGDKDGPIRKKFQKEPTLSAEDIALWEKGEHPNQDEISIILTQKNVIHTSDTNEEAIENLKMLLGDRFKAMQMRGNLPSELWDIFE